MRGFVSREASECAGREAPPLRIFVASHLVCDVKAKIEKKKAKAEIKRKKKEKEE